MRSVREVDYDWDPTTPVPDWLKCVAWCDGGIPQLQAMINDELQDKDTALKIDRNKHAAAASAVQQMADLCPIFRGTKQGSKLITAACNFCSTLAKKLEDHFRKTKVLNMEGRKLKGAIDLLACLPSTLAKVRSASSMVLRRYVLQKLTSYLLNYVPLLSPVCSSWQCEEWLPRSRSDRQ